MLVEEYHTVGSDFGVFTDKDSCQQVCIDNIGKFRVWCAFEKGSL